MRETVLEKKLLSLILLVIYSDIYDYALKVENLVKFWGIDEVSLKKGLSLQLLESYKGRIFLPERQKLVGKSIFAEETAKNKIEIARKYLEIFKKIPFIKFVGISGSVGAMNAKESDDIDIFLIVRKNTKWIVRMFEIFIFGFFLKVRNFSYSPNLKNHLCFNLLLEGDNYLLPETKRNLYSAYQCLLVHPLVGKEHYYDFLRVNSWIEGYFLPTKLWQKIALHEGKKQNKSTIKKILSLIEDFFLIPINFLLGIPQIIKIWTNGGDLNKIVANGSLFFHPENPEKNILARYNQKKQKFFKARHLAE